jgi:hypothetical protein
MNASIAFRWLHAEEILLGRKQFETGVSPCAKTCSIGDAVRRRHSDSTPRRGRSCGITSPAHGHTAPEEIGRVSQCHER